MKCDADIRKELYSKIVLAGGTSMIRNLKDRVEKDVKALAPSNMPIEVHSPPERAYSAWLGGSILSMIETFRPMFITKPEFEENGPTAVYRKCF
jgi:actin-related protein